MKLQNPSPSNLLGTTPFAHGQNIVREQDDYLVLNPHLKSEVFKYVPGQNRLLDISVFFHPDVPFMR